MEALGSRHAEDSEQPPPAPFPWHVACALGIAFLFGGAGLHWAYLLPVFWVLLHMDERRRRTAWATMKRDLIAFHPSSDDPNDENAHAESVLWLNQLLRAVWPMYEPPIARYISGKLQPYLDKYVPRSLGVFGLRIKRFSLGSLATIRSGDKSQRLAPLVMERVKMISKSINATSKDQRLHSVNYVFQVDIRWHTGQSPSVVLDIQLGPKLLSLSVDAEVREVVAAGTLRMELQWVRAYPWLSSISMAFVRPPSVDFKLSLGGSPDVMDLAPPLRSWLKQLIDDTMKSYMVGSKQFVVPLSEWYGEKASVSSALAEPLIRPPMPTSIAEPPSRPRKPPPPVGMTEPRALSYSSEDPLSRGRGDKRGGEERQRGVEERQLSVSNPEVVPTDDASSSAGATGPKQRATGNLHAARHGPGKVSPANCEPSLPPPELRMPPELRNRISRYTSRHSCLGRGENQEADAPQMTSEEFFGSADRWNRTSSPACCQEASHRRGLHDLDSQVFDSVGSLPQALHDSEGSDEEIRHLMSLRNDKQVAAPSPVIAPTSGAGVPYAGLRRFRLEDDGGSYTRPSPATDLVPTGAVGELIVEVSHASHFVPLASSGAHLVITMAVGDGGEQRGAPVEVSRSSRTDELQVPVQQRFCLYVHDSITQLLNTQLLLLTKQPKREVVLLGTSTVALSDLRVDMPVAKAIRLNDDRHAPILLHCTFLYRLFDSM